MAGRLANILAVTVYLVAVGSFLLVTRRIRVKPSGVIRVILASLRPLFSSELSEMTHDRGNCYIAPLGKKLISDSNGRSRLTLFEDDQALLYPHAAHDDIRELGAGRYSHWGDAVFFSTSDNTNPVTNGRRYRVQGS